MDTSGTVPSSFTLSLTTLLEGSKFEIPDARCTFSYFWDPHTKNGQAQLVGINGSMLAITLFLKAHNGLLTFKSKTRPTLYRIKGNEVVIYSVHLQILQESGNKNAAIAFNYDNSVIQSNKGYDLK